MISQKVKRLNLDENALNEWDFSNARTTKNVMVKLVDAEKSLDNDDDDGMGLFAPSNKQARGPPRETRTNTALGRGKAWDHH